MARPSRVIPHLYKEPAGGKKYEENVLLFVHERALLGTADERRRAAIHFGDRESP